MAAELIDLYDDTAAPRRCEEPQRIEFIKCQTAYCLTNLGVRLPVGRVHWHVPVQHNYQDGSTRVECPYRHAIRVWTPKRGGPRR